MQACLLCLRAKYTHSTNMLVSVHCFDFYKDLWVFIKQFQCIKNKIDLCDLHTLKVKFLGLCLKKSRFNS